jgi:hypothetical protein
MLQIAIVAVPGAVAFGFVLCAMLVSGTGAPGVERALVAEGWRSIDRRRSAAIESTSRNLDPVAPSTLVTTGGRHAPTGRRLPSFRARPWAVILAGGEGCRLRQLTRSISGDDRPKQFCAVVGTDTLLSDTRRRAALIAPANRTLVVVTKRHECFYRPLLADMREPSVVVHSFWSDQYEHNIEYVGFAARWDRVIFRSQPKSRRFLGFYLKDGIVRAVVGLNRGGDPEDPKVDGELKAAVNLVRNRAAVDSAKLVDEDVDLRRLVVAAAR